MARIEVPMPQMGESIAEGTVSVWRKKVGERVERDEPIMEISTDKVDAEIPSPAAGVLAEIAVQEGQTVEVGTVVAYIDTEAAVGAQPGAPSSAPAEPAMAGEQPTTLPGAAAGEAEEPAPTAAAAPAQTTQVSAGSSGNGGGPESAEERLRRRSTPLVRKIAAEHGVEVAAVQGSGRAGRVTREDILRHVEERQPRRPAPYASGRATRSPGPVAPGSFPWEEFYTHVDHPTVAVGANDRAEPLNRMTSLIAEHMVLSRRISAHVHSYFEIDYSRIDQVRAKNRRGYEEQGVKVTYTAYIARAVAMALREHPKLNAALSGESGHLPRRREPGHCGGAGERADRPGGAQRGRSIADGAGAQDHRPGDARPLQEALPRKCRAAPSPSPTRGSSARQSASRSSTSPRWRSWASAAWRSAR